MITGLPQDWEKQRFHYWRTKTKLCAYQNPGERSSVTLQKTEPDLPARVGMSPTPAHTTHTHTHTHTHTQSGRVCQKRLTVETQALAAAILEGALGISPLGGHY